MNSFLIQAAIYLGSAIICVPIAKRLGLSSVLGYLIAGMVIGPHLLGLVGEESQDVMHVAEFGVVIMLFLIGLELRPATLWQLRSSIFGIGTIQVATTAILIMLITKFLGFPWVASLVIGLTLSLSSTAIVLQSLSEKVQTNTAAGKLSFSVLLLQDLAVIPILALLPFLADSAAAADGSHGSSLVLPAWLKAVIVPTAVGLVVLAGKYVLEPMLRIIAHTRLRELIVGIALFIVVGIAEIMIIAGISPALGAFLAGLMLANSAFRHQLETDLEPFKGLFLGLFFIAVGSSINFPLLMKQPEIILGMTLAMIALKLLIFVGLGKLARLSNHQSVVLSSTMAQASEFAFVILGLALQLKVMEQSLAEVLVAIVALSMAFSPLVQLLLDKTILNRMVTVKAENDRPQDTPPSHRRVILAGFGEYGSTVGRYLRANGVEATILDNDPDRVDLLRKLGFEVYYGDIQREDMLETAGIADAALLILAMGKPEINRRIISHVKQRYPEVKIMVRTINRFESYELIDQGLEHVYRQTFDSALRMGVDALHLLGYRRYAAHIAALKFRKYDESEMRELAKLRHDEPSYIQNARKSIEDQEELLRDDMARGGRFEHDSWDSAALRG